MNIPEQPAKKKRRKLSPIGIPDADRPVKLSVRNMPDGLKSVLKALSDYDKGKESK